VNFIPCCHGQSQNKKQAEIQQNILEKGRGFFTLDHGFGTHYAKWIRKASMIGLKITDKPYF